VSVPTLRSVRFLGLESSAETYGVLGSRTVSVTRVGGGVAFVSFTVVLGVNGAAVLAQ